MKEIKRAIISVFDKSNVLEFVKVLVDDFGVEILSTGGTGRLLEQNGISYIKISDYTKSPEMFDGRVKTLHPKVEGGILYRRELEKDMEDAKKYDIPPIDMVVCNLYQFKEAIAKPDITLKEALEMIDIGGPTMIRAAAKNFPDVVVVPSPKYYDIIIKQLKEKEGISDELRATLAQDVFTLMADYNAAIANYLQNYYNPEALIGNHLIKVYEKVQDCRYGENWDQAAGYYRDVSAKQGLHN
ncbi:MAG: bifunctional phosphoribosylaminoimidazolecarboxamide formyltransferase/IMP cyclohydrolase, partial [Promethearchaeota archaeon]